MSINDIRGILNDDRCKRKKKKKDLKKSQELQILAITWSEINKAHRCTHDFSLMRISVLEIRFIFYLLHRIYLFSFSPTYVNRFVFIFLNFFNLLFFLFLHFFKFIFFPCFFFYFSSLWGDYIRLFYNLVG
jgi:hypothetical protein